MPTPLNFPVVQVGGFPTASITRADLAAVMVSDCLKARQSRDSWLPKIVLSSNGQGIALAGRSDEFSEIMNQADIIHADGMPVVFASTLTHSPLPERIATTDFFHDAATAATNHRLSFYMLGSSEKQNKAAVDAIHRLYPDLQIVGRRNGYFSEQEEASICEEIRNSGADVLWVALGKPKQEYWAIRNRENLRGVGWIKTCGGLYAFLAGDAPRAPTWMQAIGMEWLYRAIKEPSRLGWRYATTNPYALYRLALYTEWSRWKRPGA